MAIDLASPVQAKLRDFILDNRKTVPLDFIQKGECLGRRVAICGAGPSLADARISGVDDVWACNSALPFLLARGTRVTAAVGIDQTVGLIRDWSDAPDVPYFVASSCDPSTIAHLLSHGRTVRFLHNFVGCDEREWDLYNETWPGPMIVLGEGLSVTSRAIGLAQWMGYERIDIYGADCAFGPDDVTHANGEIATEAYRNPLIMSGEIDGRVYRTRPDMLMDAVHLVRRVRAAEGRIRLLGDTLPVALLGKSDAFLDEVCRRVMPGDAIPAPSGIPSEMT